jgi:AbrB family looped-hinge helix DNA binding protein
MMDATRITSQGQVSVPAAIRKSLGLTPGSLIEWIVQGDEVIVRRSGRLDSQAMHDAIFQGRKPVSNGMTKDEAIAAHFREKYARG